MLFCPFFSEHKTKHGPISGVFELEYICIIRSFLGDIGCIGKFFFRKSIFVGGDYFLIEYLQRKGRG